MIAPRSTRLVRVPGLRSFRETILHLCDSMPVAEARACVVLVPSRSAAEHLRRSLEDARPLPGSVTVVPCLATRGEWLDLLTAALPGAPRLLAPHDREVILEASARAAIAAGFVPPFRLRPGLVGEMLALYDAVRRHGRTVDDLRHAASETFTQYLDTDSGAARMLEQAHFLVEAFRDYEARVAASGRADEHAARDRLLAAPTSPFRRVIVAVGDAATDGGGLWPADFDLVTRLHGVDHIDVVATDATLAAGLLPRLRRWLPGLAEERAQDFQHALPDLVVPADGTGRRHAEYRDREDELIAIARGIKAAARKGTGAPLSKTGVVFKRPLPYVYLAGRVFGDAGVPFDTFDALPLAAEPYAAALDLVIECVESDFSRESLVAVLRSPHFACGQGGRTVPRLGTGLLDRALSDARYLGQASELLGLARRWQDRAGLPDGPAPELVAAGNAAAHVVERLAPIAGAARPAAHIDLLLEFLDRFDAVPPADDPVRDRHMRARAGVRLVLTGLRDAHLAWNDESCPFADTVARVRRSIERQTFAPRSGAGGVLLVDAQAAKFARLDRVYLAGLIQADWPEVPRRNIFFPASLLKNLGWPDEEDRRAEGRAGFEDLIGLAEQGVSVSTFILESDAIVEPSPFLDELDRFALPVVEEERLTSDLGFLSEALELGRPPLDSLPGPVREWVALREGRTPAGDPRFHGQSGGAGRPSYRVSALDTYLDCPFKYFAAEVLRLPEEPDDEESLSPRTRGRVAHDAFQRFFEEWQQADRGSVTVDNIHEARALFATVVDDLVSTLPGTDAALARAGLLGSPARVGAGEIVFQLEAEQPGAVVERLLEFTLDGETDLRGGGRTRSLVLKARADRIDLLDDGTFRLIDYKLSRAPSVTRAVQLPAYAAAARARLQGYRGHDWQAADAAYVTFGKPPNYVPVARGKVSLDAALAAGEARLIEAVERIEQGRFPPRPADRHLCVTCPFSGVCRRDYADGD